MVGRDRSQRPKILATRLCDGQRFGQLGLSRHFVPVPKEASRAIKKESCKFRRRQRDAKLIDNNSVEIGDCEQVAARIPGQVRVRISGLNSSRLLVEAMADDSSGQRAKGRPNPALEIYHGDKTILGITDVCVGNAITKRARFVLVLLRRNDDECDVTVGRGQLISIDVAKNEAVRFAGRKRIRLSPDGGKQGCREKHLNDPGDHVSRLA